MRYRRALKGAGVGALRAANVGLQEALVWGAKGRRPLLEYALNLTLGSMSCAPNAVQRRKRDSADYLPAVERRIMR